MSEYAVFWKDSAEPFALYGGGLAIEDDRIRLRGRSGGPLVVQHVPRESVAGIEPAPDELGGFPSLRLDLHTGRSLLLASVVGVGVLVEVLEALVGALPG